MRKHTPTLIKRHRNGSFSIKTGSCSGNVLFLILIAVALFAALSYAVTQSSRSGGDGVSKDKAKLAASQIIQYATSVEQTISRLKVINRCTDTQINFDNNIIADYDNTLAPSDGRCDVFGGNGGALPFITPEDNWFKGQTLPRWNKQFIYTGRDCYSNVGSGGDTSTCFNNGTNEDTELAVLLIDISDEICDEINKKFGLRKATQASSNGNTYDHPETDGKFKGSYGTSPTGSSHIHIASGYVNELSSQTTGCIFDQSPNANIFFHVLIAR